MEDVTDWVYRKLVCDHGEPDVLMTEFTSAAILCSDRPDRALERLVVYPGELERRPLVAQIWGADPVQMGRAARICTERGFAGIDINMGCPAEKVVRRGECSGLIDRPSLAQELILAAQEAAGSAPVSVKTRLGVRAVKIEEWAGFLLNLNLPLLTIHGRIAAQMSEGAADWAAIRRVRELRDQMGKTTLIAGNGDLFSAEDLDRRHDETGVDGLMVGRGIFRDPDIFRKDRPHRSFAEAPWDERKAVMVQHTLEHRRVWGGQKGYDMLKQFYKCYTRGPEEYLSLREKLFATRSYEAALEVLETWSPPA